MWKAGKGRAGILERSGQSPSALGASRGTEAFRCARSPAAFRESCARPRVVLTARPGRSGQLGCRRGQTLCARPASCGYNSARLLGSNTPPTGPVDLLATCSGPRTSLFLQMDPNCSCPTGKGPLALSLGCALPSVGQKVPAAREGRMWSLCSRGLLSLNQWFFLVRIMRPFISLCHPAAFFCCLVFSLSSCTVCWILVPRPGMVPVPPCRGSREA